MKKTVTKCHECNGKLPEFPFVCWCKKKFCSEKCKEDHNVRIEMKKKRSFRRGFRG